ncbi:hypothetical protein JCM10135_00150 [Stetteria hydrogenophila]
MGVGAGRARGFVELLDGARWGRLFTVVYLRDRIESGVESAGRSLEELTA